MIRKTAFFMLLVCGATVALAEDSWLTLEIPTINVAEYHRPYVAIWLHEADTGAIHNIAVWYQMDKEGDKGQQWLKDMRQWWRRSGRRAEMPLDGISGATRPPGVHKLDIRSLIASLPAGNYLLYAEAAREVGGRELLKIPFSLPLAKNETLSVEGDSELGKLEIHLAK